MHDVGGDSGVREYSVAERLEMECACEYFEGAGHMLLVAVYVGKCKLASNNGIESINDLKESGWPREEGV